MNEFIEHIIKNGTKDIVEQEAVPGGFRPLVTHYNLGEDVVEEKIFYLYDSNNYAWDAENLPRIYRLIEEGE
jgi:hypothetical protein